MQRDLPADNNCSAVRGISMSLALRQLLNRTICPAAFADNSQVDLGCGKGFIVYQVGPGHMRGTTTLSASAHC